MDLIKITDLTNQLGVSSRSLRYYEQVGLIQSVRSEFEKYRYYDAENIERLKQIIVLRKMQIPIKDIIRIYESEDMSTVVEVFVDRINAIEEETNALTELKRIVSEFLQTMIQNGITKISAIPLLYEEMDKQLEVLEEHKPVTYEELTAINEKLTGPLDVKIVILPEMRVLTSCYKAGNESDTDAFWEWINDNHIDYGTPGSHMFFEQQNNETDRDSQINVVKIPDDWDNISPFIDRIFTGGLFAVAGAYVDEDINQTFTSMLRAFDNNKYYEVDYLHDGKLRAGPLIESVISTDELREKTDIFVPVKKRLADIANYDNGIQSALNISLTEVERANPVGQAIAVDLHSMSYTGMRVIDNAGNFDYKFYDYNGKGEIALHSYLLARQLVSNERIKIPFMVEVDCIIPNEKMEIRICHDIGFIEIRFPDGNLQITIREPVFGTERLENKYIASNNITFGKDANIKWIAGEKYFAVIINGEVKYCGTHFAYMQVDRNTFEEYPVRIAAAHEFDSATIKSICIYPVMPVKINKLKKGELKMFTKQSNNILPDLHPLVTYHYGENYNFNACMKMLMEYAEPDEMYSYSFFAGISGDNFVQVYGKKEQYENYNGSLSCVWDGKDLIKYVFGEIGYEYSYITAEQISANKSMYIETVKAFIDKGLPVIFKQDRGWQPIVGYEENGNVLLYMDGENTESIKLNTAGISKEWALNKEIAQDWIFIGAKIKEPDIREIYINAFSHIAKLLNSPDKYGCSFGPKAFRDWADDIENGRFDGMTQERFDGWKYYAVYICNLSTNFCGVSFDFLSKAISAVPELACLKDEYGKMNENSSEINGKLQELEGNFNVTLAALQDRERRTAIANEIRKFAPKYEKFAKLIKEKVK
ncbi:MAG: MerR family transcriptional regulator [Clostridiales bacterium]|jgi:DNA-binding transcriptional MerR regulator|nr:MerR family transcriptional regulator [Clostridiales bacterium]